jgi:thiamine biosynthesis lipoprotein
MSDSLFHSSRAAMGTTASVWVYAGSPAISTPLIEAAFAELERVEQALSGYRSTSEVSRLNRQAGKDWVTTDPEVFGLLKRSVALSAATDGAFDVSIGRLIRALGFLGDPARSLGSSEVDRAMMRIGYQQILFRDETREIRFAVEGMEIDFGANGKGYGVDRAAGALRAGGVSAALVGIGQSSYFAIGAPPADSVWVVEITDPRDPALVIGEVALRDGSLSTSGGGATPDRGGGRTFGHIIDPRTGQSVVGVWQVTVKAPSAEESDALATACFVVGYGECKALLEARGETHEALWIGPVDGIPTVRSFNWTSSLDRSIDAGYAIH